MAQIHILIPSASQGWFQQAVTQYAVVAAMAPLSRDALLGAAYALAAPPSPPDPAAAAAG
jgi:hypothetical protein